MNIDLNKLNYQNLKRKDSPESVKAKNPNNIHNVNFSIDDECNPNGIIYVILSVIADKQGNAYSRQETISISYEQKYYPDINNDIVATLIRLIITKQSYDLGIENGLVLCPTHETIVNILDE